MEIFMSENSYVEKKNINNKTTLNTSLSKKMLKYTRSAYKFSKQVPKFKLKYRCFQGIHLYFVEVMKPWHRVGWSSCGTERNNACLTVWVEHWPGAESPESCEQSILEVS